MNGVNQINDVTLYKLSNDDKAMAYVQYRFVSLLVGNVPTFQKGNYLLIHE